MILQEQEDESITINKTMIFMQIIDDQHIITRVKQLQVSDHVAKEQLVDQSTE
jgi:hypothetical protein